MFHVTDPNVFALFVLRRYCVAVALLVAVLFEANTAVATEWIKETRYFLITRDFQRFKIPASAAVFFKTKTSCGAEEPAAEIREETRRLLGTRLRFIDNSAEAQYGISVRLEEYTDYATSQPLRMAGDGVRHVCHMYPSFQGNDRELPEFDFLLFRRPTEIDDVPPRRRGVTRARDRVAQPRPATASAKSARRRANQQLGEKQFPRVRPPTAFVCYAR